MLTAPAEASCLLAGDLVAGRYRLRAERGSGGMGTVWEAEHVALKRPVAVKFLTLSRADAGVLCDRFLREARAAAAVRHRNVVDIIDFGTMSDGQPFMVMELLEGRSLGEVLDYDEPIAKADLARIASGILSGLAAVHAAGLLHGDIKPDNVFLVREAGVEIAKLVDFGVSRAQHGGSERRESVVPTVEGLVLGTPAYMSPEQARGEADLDARADVYSTGALLYELLARRVPFDGTTPADVIAQVLRDTPEPLERLRPDLPRSVVQVIATAMARDKAARFATADAMRIALEKAFEEALVPPARAEARPERAVGETLDAPPEASPHVPASIALPSIATASIATIDEGSSASRPRSARSSRALGALSGAVLFAAAAMLASFTQASSEPRAAASPVAPAPPAPARATVSEVAVELASLPPGALVYVDGVLAVPPLGLPADGRAHVIEVRAEGYRPWVVSHVPSASTRLDVHAVPRPARASVTPPAPSISAPPPAPSRPARRGRAAALLIRSPDF